MIFAFLFAFFVKEDRLDYDGYFGMGAATLIELLAEISLIAKIAGVF